MGGVNFVTNLLHPCHTSLIVDLNVGLGAGHYKSAPISRVVNCVKFICFIKDDVFDRIAHTRRPPNYATIQAGAEQFLRLRALVRSGLPGETRDGKSHLVVLQREHLITHHGVDNLHRAIKETHRCKSSVTIKAHMEDIGVSKHGSLAVAEMAESEATTALDGTVRCLVVLHSGGLLARRLNSHTLHCFLFVFYLFD